MPTTHRPRHDVGGRSLVEILFVLLLLSVLVGRAVQPVRHMQDRVVVIAARETVIAELRRARMVAVKIGSARLVIREDPSELAVEVPTGEGAAWVPVNPPVALGARRGVALEVAGASEQAELRFDGMGLGRGVGRTLVLRRGDAEVGVVVSSYGRARRI